MREQPGQTYFVGCRASLVVRFEEFGADDAPKAPEVPPQLRKGTKAVIDKLQIKADDQGRLELIGPAVATGGPQKQIASTDGRTHPIAGIVPKTASWNRNGVREADTLEMEFKFIDMPIDPRVVRSCAVEFYLGCFTEEEFMRGLGGSASDQHDGFGAPLNIIADEYTDTAGRIRSNLRFQGWVDQWDVEFGENAEPLVRLVCTDNTRLFIEQEAPPALQVKASEKLDRAIADYLSNFPQYVGFVIEYRPKGIEPPTLDTAFTKTAKAKSQGPSVSGGGQGKMSVWDYLTDVCGSVGHNIRVEGITIVLQLARTLYATGAVRTDDPFSGVVRILPSGRRISGRRLFVYGQNLTDLRFGRKYARQAPTNLEIRCYSPKRKKTLIARHPQKDKRQKRINPGEAADQNWKVVWIYGIDDERVLARVAQDVYESQGRNELEVDFSTRNLSSFGGDSHDLDVLDMLPGDPVDVEVNREIDPPLNAVTGVEETIAQRAAEFLTAVGYSPEFAGAYKDAVANIGYPTTFRVRALTVDWDETDSATVSVECINYLESRADAELPAGEEPEVTPQDAGEQIEIIVQGESG